MRALAAGILTNFSSIIGAESTNYSDFIAALEFRAAQAILPDFQRQFSPLHFLEAQLAKEFGHIGKRKYSVERIAGSFPCQGLDEPPADTVGLGAFGDG